MNEPMQGRTAIDQPEPVHDYGLTAADRMIAAAVLTQSMPDYEIKIHILEWFGRPHEYAQSVNEDRLLAYSVALVESAVLARQSVPDDFVAQLQALEKEALAIIAAGSVAQSVPDDVAKDAARLDWIVAAIDNAEFVYARVMSGDSANEIKAAIDAAIAGAKSEGEAT
jgi:hypothetical protein